MSKIYDKMCKAMKDYEDYVNGEGEDSDVYERAADMYNVLTEIRDEWELITAQKGDSNMTDEEFKKYSLDTFVFEAEDVNDPRWDVIINILKANIDGFEVRYGDGDYINFYWPDSYKIVEENEEDN